MLYWRKVKTLVFVLAVLLCVGLTGCVGRNVKEAQAAVDAITLPISADERTEIEYAQYLCGELSDEELAQVDGLDKLQEALSVLADVDAAAAVDDAIRQIHDLTVSGEELDQIDEMISGLTNRAQGMLTELDTLEQLREQQQSLVRLAEETTLQEIQNELATGQYTNARFDAEYFLEQFPSSEYTSDVCEAAALALLGEAAEYLEAGDLNLARIRIQDLYQQYPDVSSDTMSRANDMEDQIAQTQLEGIQQLYDAEDYEEVVNAGEDFLDDFNGSEYASVVEELISSAQIKIEWAQFVVVQQLYDDGEYSDTIDKGKKFRRDFPNGEYYDDALELMAEAQLNIAQAHIDSYEYYQAEKALDPFDKDYRETVAAEDAEELVDWLEDRKVTEPENGSKLYNELDSGYGELTIKAGSSSAAVKVESDNGYSMLFYVRANETATVNLRDGEFTLKYATGNTWYGKGDLFGPSTRYSLADEVLSYETTYSGNSVYYSSYEVTLYTVFGGNLEIESINADEF